MEKIGVTLPLAGAKAKHDAQSMRDLRYPAPYFEQLILLRWFLLRRFPREPVDQIQHFRLGIRHFLHADDVVPLSTADFHQVRQQHRIECYANHAFFLFSSDFIRSLSVLT